MLTAISVLFVGRLKVIVPQHQRHVFTIRLVRDDLTARSAGWTPGYSDSRQVSASRRSAVPGSVLRPQRARKLTVSRSGDEGCGVGTLPHTPSCRFRNAPTSHTATPKPRHRPPDPPANRGTHSVRCPASRLQRRCGRMPHLRAAAVGVEPDAVGEEPHRQGAGKADGVLQLPGELLFENVRRHA